MIDSNVFVAAIKNPRKSTRTLELLLKMIEAPTIGLVGNDLLIHEMVRYAELLKSPIAAALVAALLDKTALVSVSERYRKICASYLKTPDPADILHASTCLPSFHVVPTESLFSRYSHGLGGKDAHDRNRRRSARENLDPRGN